MYLAMGYSCLLFTGARENDHVTHTQRTVDDDASAFGGISLKDDKSPSQVWLS